MDIHAPEGPTRSFREFAIHIAIVTVGILIALGLEGIREAVHDHHLVRETKESFEGELASNANNATREMQNVQDVNGRLDQLLKDLPELQAKPAELRARVADVRTSGYFFGDSSWQGALSTGALAHMPTREVTLYAVAFQGVREYVGLQHGEIPAEFSLHAFAAAHASFSDADMVTLTERVLLVQQYERAMRQVGEELQADIRRATHI